MAADPAAALLPPHTTLLYIGISADHEIDIPSSPAFAITVPANDVVPQAAYEIAYYDRAAGSWVFPFQMRANDLKVLSVLGRN